MPWFGQNILVLYSFGYKLSSSHADMSYIVVSSHPDLMLINQSLRVKLSLYVHVSATEPDLRGHTGARAAVEDPETHHSTGTGQCQGVLTGRGVRGRPTGGWGCVNGSIL